MATSRGAVRTVNKEAEFELGRVRFENKIYDD
jgi:hypothetical protein